MPHFSCLGIPSGCNSVCYCLMDCVDYAHFRMCQIIGLTASPVSKNTDAASAAALEALALSLKAHYVVLDESSSILAVRVRAVATHMT